MVERKKRVTGVKIIYSKTKIVANRVHGKNVIATWF